MRVLVLGSSGQLGKCLQDQLKTKDNSIFFRDKSQINIKNFKETEKEISKLCPDIIINAAAYTAVDLAESNHNEANLINNLSVENIARISKSLNSILIHISTDYVFDGEFNEPYTEKAVSNPSTVYGLSKLNGEQSIKNSKCMYIIIRTSWLFSEYNNNFFKTMLNVSNSKKELEVVCDQFGTPTYAQDLARALNKVVERVENKNFELGTFHYGGNSTCSWYDFACEIFNQLNSDIKVIPVTSDKFPTKASRPLNSSLNSNKIVLSYDVNSSDWIKGISSALKRVKD